MILIVGASGILGQHLRISQPPGESAVYTSRAQSLPKDYPLTLETPDHVDTLLDRWRPDVVINLAGENRPDVVERDPAAYEFINVDVPALMAQWCTLNSRRLIHVSSQAVFGGLRPPYASHVMTPERELILADAPVNAYGRQKLRAEGEVIDRLGTVARLTFILGVRPFPYVGRPNPMEQMIEALEHASPQRQVIDRFFSPAFAPDAARWLWHLSRYQAQPGRVYHIGHPVQKSRFEIAMEMGFWMTHGPDFASDSIRPVHHDESFPAPQWAPRPINTTFADDSLHRGTYEKWLPQTLTSWRRRLNYMDRTDRAVEIATFLGKSPQEVEARLGQGFGAMHTAVRDDFYQTNPQTDEDLLRWYMSTEAYIWELTAYHLDPGFNYLGMCDGITTHLKVHDKSRVLCVGDGVGDLTMRCKDAGLRPVYHDLAGSRTAQFAHFRFQRRYGGDTPWMENSTGWEAPHAHDLGSEEQFDAVIALDFFEHMVDVEGWVRRCWAMLRPGGLFLAQNAFGIGNEPGGSLPMHLTRNNRYEKDWDPLLDSIGFVRTGAGNWRRKP